jgi:hypothetical protein
MKVELRIPGQIYADALADLMRPHPFAAERVGFFSTAVGRLGDDGMIVLVTSYSVVGDQDYIDDPGAGARIGADAIRAVLQRILDHDCGQLHVHLHCHSGLPRPSRMDEREMPPLARSMGKVGLGHAHGAVILSRDRAWANVWAPGNVRPVLASKVTVVGFLFGFLCR